MRLGDRRIDGFLIALAGAIALAALAPGVGATGGALRLDRIAGAAVTLVFFLHGTQLSLGSLARGARNLRLHLLVQSFCFGVFPLVGALLFVATGALLPAGLALGFFYLSAVSSTLASSVALTAVAHGNVAGALFNATLSGILGVLLTPLLVSLVAPTAGVELPLGAAIAAVALKVLLPLALGQLARPLLGGTLGRYRNLVGLADRGSIALIVYGAFCDSFSAGIWVRTPWWALLAVLAIAAALLATMVVAVRSAARRLGLPPADEAAALFCGSQKSLANGLPIARVLFAGSPQLGLIVLPMIVYHQLQLAAGAVLARRYADAARVRA